MFEFVKAWFSIIIGFFNIFLLVWWLGLSEWNLDMDSKGKNPHVGRKAQVREWHQGVWEAIMNDDVNWHKWCFHLMMILKDITQIIYQSWKVIHSKVAFGRWLMSGNLSQGGKMLEMSTRTSTSLGWRWVTCFFVWVELAQGRHCGRTNMVGHRSCMGG